MMDPSGESLFFLVEHQYQNPQILTGIVLFLEMILIPHLRIKNLGKQFMLGTSNVDLVSSPVKIGTKSARIGYPNDGMLAYSKRNEYDFTGMDYRGLVLS